MKSLVEEASSIFKALEKAWERAGKPESFSVKVFELPEKNFFGFTKKNAKVGIFFEEQQSTTVNARRNDSNYRNNRRRPDDQRNAPDQRQPRTGDRLDRNADQKSNNVAPVANQRDATVAPREPRENNAGGENRQRYNDSRSSSRPRRNDGDREQRGPRSNNRYQSNDSKDSFVKPAQDNSVTSAPIQQQPRVEEPVVERRVLRVSNRQYDATVANTKKEE